MTKRKHLLFFAMRDDLLPVLDAVEHGCSLKYVLMGNFLKSEPLRTYDSGAAIEKLGFASVDSASACESFLVGDRSALIVQRPILSNSGVERYCIDQLANQDTVSFTPGGVWNSEIILHGRVATASESVVSQDLMKRFERAIKRNFRKIKSFYVGPARLYCSTKGIRG